ncbi:ABC transporter ATP-binding protein [Rubellimicrobium sp. CFH 75288]|uniref:ABC transporter ATP-binding protein n=1 Tax=Rubellimicrobium sp. CFH 75288 TaxID=2697034 RepID=UPI0014121819|nr:ABC transporter ATP-binding protein [Rubellimicrobium sp. CFH 75288]NAZ37850.1 ATP-binding cassette domain-containing protein [Rubellimicrobium sp. CFH 75288]
MGGIVIRGLCKGWGGVTALADLDLDVAEGEFLVLLGPSGCGKTTTMRLIAGLETPDAGTIRIGADDVTDWPPRDRDVAMVFQSYGLYPHMSVAENIGYPLRLRGMRREERARLVAEAAERVGLGPYLDRRPRALSGGQRQRVALARAIVRRPRLFLMDEPLSNLDAKLRVSMRAELKRLHHDLGTTIVYVTHDQSEAMTLATRVAVMEGGRIRQLDTPQAIYERPADRFVAGFVGSPPMNFLPVRGGPEGAEVAGQRIEGIAVPGAAVLGIRPEDLEVVAPEAAGLCAQVFAVEFTGAATLATLRLGGEMVQATCRPGAPVPDYDETVGLRIRPGRAHLFDAATGRRIAA